MRIVVDDLSGPAIAAFLAEHIEEMLSITPVESKHALDLDSLASQGVDADASAAVAGFNLRFHTIARATLIPVYGH